MITSTNKIRTVPSIIVHDDERDVSVVYEGQKFTDYMNTFIHNHQAKYQANRPVSNAFTLSQQKHANAHQLMQNNMKQARFNMAYHQANNPYLDENKQPEIQHVMRSNIHHSVFGQNTPDNFRSQADQFKQGIQNTISEQEERYKNNKAETDSTRELERQQRVEKALEQNKVEQAMIDDQRRKDAEERDRQNELQMKEMVERERLILLQRIKEHPMTKDLTHTDQLNMMEQQMIDSEITKIDAEMVHISQSIQIKQSNPNLHHMANHSELHNKLSDLSKKKQNMILKKQALPPVINQKQIELEQRQMHMRKTQEEQHRNNIENTPKFKLIGEKYEIQKQMQAVQHYLTSNPESDEAKIKLEQLGFLYNEVDSQLKSLQQSSEQPPVFVPESKKESFNDSIPKHSNHVALQQNKQQQQVELYKTQERQHKPQGVTNLDDLEESLYDKQKQFEKPEHRRPIGTDIRQSEAQIEASIQASKKTSINQRVREMSNNREVRPVKGAGHETMLSSLSVTEKSNEREQPSFTPLTDLGIDMNDSFDSFDNTGQDVIDGDVQEEEQPVATTAIKKKSSVIDRAKEMEKSRM
jgi:hypothetical protein